MKPVVSIIMGSTSDLPVMEKAAKLLDEMQVPFEMNALSAHRTPAEVEAFAKGAAKRGIKVIIAAAGMAAGFARCYCCQYHIACNRCSGKRFCTRWRRRTVFYYSDASRYSCSYCSD